MKWPFKRKSAFEAEIADLQQRLHDKDTQLLAKDTQITYLIRTIRGMDDIVWSMGQCTDWKSMRPRFVQLQEQMTSRKVAESNRIGSLIESELHSVYDPQSQPKLEHKR